MLKNQKMVENFKKSAIVKQLDVINYTWDENIIDNCFTFLLNSNRSPSNGWFKRLATFALYDLDKNTWLDRVSKISVMKQHGVTLERLLITYGDKEGNIRWENYCKQQAKTNTYEYKKNTHGWSKEEFDTYNKSRSTTLKNMIDRHGLEKGQFLWDKYVQRQRFTTTLEYFQDKHGKELGLEKWENYLVTWLSTNGNSVSMAETRFLSDLGLDIEEQFIIPSNPDDGRCAYSFDAKIKNTNKLVEFNGDFWHMNPKIYKSTDINSVNNKTAEVIWDQHNKKLLFAKSLGFDVFVVWEGDIKERKHEIIREIQTWSKK